MMNRDTATAIWYRRIDPTSFTAPAAGVARATAADAPAARTPVPAAFVRAWEPRREAHGLTRLRALFGRL